MECDKVLADYCLDKAESCLEAAEAQTLALSHELSERPFSPGSPPTAPVSAREPDGHEAASRG